MGVKDRRTDQGKAVVYDANMEMCIYRNSFVYYVLWTLVHPIICGIFVIITISITKRIWRNLMSTLFKVFCNIRTMHTVCSSMTQSENLIHLCFMVFDSLARAYSAGEEVHLVLCTQFFALFVRAGNTTLAYRLMMAGYCPVSVLISRMDRSDFFFAAFAIVHVITRGKKR